MTQISIFQFLLYLITLILLVKPLGWYMARIYENKPVRLVNWLGPFEKIIYRLCGIHPHKEMNWKEYLSAMLIFNLVGLLLVYGILRLQFYLPLNAKHFTAFSEHLAFNTTASFATNTNWQSYSPESMASDFTQMVALTLQNFLSAATGMALLMAFIRGLTRNEGKSLGNFWQDLTRGILYILLPLSFIFTLFLVSQGVIQNFNPPQKGELIQPISYLDNSSPLFPKTMTQSAQWIPTGPVASQVAIKQLGTNGRGFFNTNAAHPFENPTPLSNFGEMLAILLIPAALCYTFGKLVHDKRQGWAILIAMLIPFISFTILANYAEHQTNPAFVSLGISAGNMEGKETRLGITNSALWATATTASSNGSVNAMLDSFTPLGGMVSLWMMHLGEVVFGGVGSGLYVMIMMVIITVFIAGLLVGRTPEYLGKKIEPYEMKMATFGVLVMPLMVLIATAFAAVSKEGINSIANPGPHGFTEILYAFTSMGSNNGSSFAGLKANTPFYNIIGGLIMLITRYWIAIVTLAIAGSLVQKKRIPSTPGTLETHTPLFIVMLVSVILIMGSLSFLPSIALGPIVEQLILWSQHGH